MIPTVLTSGGAQMASSSGTYILHAGELSTQREYVGSVSTGLVDQSGGPIRSATGSTSATRPGSYYLSGTATLRSR
jgi:hypothetical protein